MNTTYNTIHITKDDETEKINLLLDGGGILKLFQVAITYHKPCPESVSIYVLAANERNAILQATCRNQNDDRNEPKATAIQLPIRIQGWGTRTF